MKDQLITFETAKLAKEKGFDIKTSKFYKEDGEICHFRLATNTHEEFCPAPTQSLLQKWLREEHRLMIGLVHYQTFGGFWEWRIHYQERFGKADIYEEALETGLQEALKLIEVDNNLNQKLII